MPPCPQLGDLYPTDNYAWCRSRRVTQDPKSKLIWIVTAQYSSDYPVYANPLAEPAGSRSGPRPTAGRTLWTATATRS